MLERILVASALLVEFKVAIFTIFSNTIFNELVGTTPALPPFFFASNFSTNLYTSCMALEVSTILSRVLEKNEPLPSIIFVIKRC